MMMGFSIYGVAVIDGSLYSRFYGMYMGVYIEHFSLLNFSFLQAIVEFRYLSSSNVHV